MTAQTTMIAMIAEPVEVDGKWWIDVSMNGHKLKRQGPFPNADVAKTKADQLIQQWQPKKPTVPATTNDVVILNGREIALDSDTGRKLVVACTRAAEGLVKDTDIIEEFEISISEWENVKTNVKLGRAIRDMGRQRVASGQRAREAAQGIFVKAPAVLDGIMSSEQASARHRIEAAREIRQVAIGGDGAENTPDAGEKFVITINLGADHIERYEKEITPRQPQQPMLEDKTNADE
jgi:hypothetical protein